MEHVKNLPNDFQIIIKQYNTDIFFDSFKMFLRTTRRPPLYKIKVSRTKAYFISEYDICSDITLDGYNDDIIFNKYKEVLMISDLHTPRDMSSKKRSMITRSYFTLFAKKHIHLDNVNELILNRVNHIQLLYQDKPLGFYKVKITLKGVSGAPIKKIIKVPLAFFICLARRINESLIIYMKFFDSIKDCCPTCVEEEMATYGPRIH